MGTEQKLTDQVYLPLLQVMRLKAHTTPRTCELLKKGKKITVKKVPKAQGRRKSWNRPWQSTRVWRVL